MSAIVSAATARTFWPGADPIGKAPSYRAPRNRDTRPAARVTGRSPSLASRGCRQRLRLRRHRTPRMSTCRQARGAPRRPRSWCVGATHRVFRSRGPAGSCSERVHEDRFAFQALPLEEVLAPADVPASDRLLDRCFARGDRDGAQRVRTLRRADLHAQSADP